MKTLADPAVLAELEARLATLTAGDRGLWGTMTVGQMICHLRDSYEIPLATRTVAPIQMPTLQRKLMKRLGLYAPFKWPPGVKTVPEVEQGVGGTPPAEFESDRAALLSILRQFAAAPIAKVPHAIFGSMTRADWMRWGYLHPDHHLRQFGR